MEKASVVADLPLRRSDLKVVVGGPDRDRTDDLFHAMEARSQLRHRPTLRKDIPYSQGCSPLSQSLDESQVAALQGWPPLLTGTRPCQSFRNSNYASICTAMGTNPPLSGV